MPAKRYFLKGIDYFQLLIDHHNKRFGGPGHEARLAIFLDGIVNESKVTALLAQNEICDRLRSLHIDKTFGLGYPSLVFSETKKNIPVSFHKVNDIEIPNSFLNIPVDVYHQPPLHIQVFYFNNKTSCILFTFHHILFDFAGVKSFINSLTGLLEIPLLPLETASVAFSKRINRFFRAVFFTFHEANHRMTIPERELPKQQPLKVIYRELQFTEAETGSIIENCSRYSLQLNRSIYQVACVSMALHRVIFSKQKNHNFIWLPVPVNFRKKGTPDAILFNGLSFLFYKLKPGVLMNLKNTIEAIQLQMKDQMRKELPQAFIDFAEGYKFMPMPFYYPMMNLPSWGKLSSFSFSTLGNTFEGMQKFIDLPVTDIKNYPSNSISPGFTFLFYEFRGKLNVMTSWVEGQYSKSEQDEVLQTLKTIMLDSKV